MHATCAHCEEPFVPRNTLQKYCNHKCSKAAEAKRYAARDRQRKGETRRPWERFRKVACEVCGWEDATPDAHHILGAAAGHWGGNIVTLCPNHHRIADRDRVVGKLSPFIVDILFERLGVA